MDQPRYLGTKEAAAYLGLSWKTLEKLRVTGKGPPYAKAGRRVIYDRHDLDEWVAERKRGFTGESVEADDARPENRDESDDEPCPEDGGESIEEDDALPEDGGESDEDPRPGP